MLFISEGMMRYSIKILIALCLCLVSYTTSAKAELIIESASQVLGKQIYEPGFGKSRSVNNTPSVTYEDKNSENYRYNYNKETDVVDDKPQVQQPSDIQLVDLNGYTTSLILSEGQYLAVRLDEANGEKWNFENRGSALEFIKSEKRSNIVILLYRAKALGNSRINFDKLKNGLAVASKILQVKVF